MLFPFLPFGYSMILCITCTYSLLGSGLSSALILHAGFCLPSITAVVAAVFLRFPFLIASAKQIVKIMLSVGFTLLNERKWQRTLYCLWMTKDNACELSRISSFLSNSLFLLVPIDEYESSCRRRSSLQHGKDDRRNGKQAEILVGSGISIFCSFTQAWYFTRLSLISGIVN